MLLGGLMLTLSALAQEAVPFNGLLLDGKGKPIRRARVYVNEDRYTQSDKQGRFGLTNVNPDDTIRIRYNKHTYEVPVAGKTTITVRVLPDLKVESEETPSLLDYGFSYVKQREYAGYDSRITGEELMRTGCTDILSALSGMIPGLNISYDDEKGTYVVDIRGSGQAADLTPLYVVDEIVVPEGLQDDAPEGGVHVSPMSNGRYRFLSGSARFERMREQGQVCMDVVLSPTEKMEARISHLLDALVRGDIHYLDEAESYRELLGSGEWNTQKLAERIGRTL